MSNSIAKLNIKVYLFDNTMINNIPKHATTGSSGLDLCSADDYIVRSGKTELISTGIGLSLPLGYEAQIRSRSGLALKHSVCVFNSPATIDSDYRGEIKVILYNAGDKDFLISKFDRIAQMVIAPYEICNLYTGEFSLDDKTDRSDSGFGSTGTK